MRVRPAELRDAPRLVEVFDAVLADGRGMVLGPGQGEDLHAVAARIQGRGDVLVVELDGEVVAEGMLRPIGPPWLAHGAMLAIQVHPDAQGRGVGRALLCALLDVARTRSLERVELYVRADNHRAIGLYRSLGFVREGVRRAFVRPPGRPAVDDWVMARFLHAPAAEKAVALVVRDGASGPELLVFAHPRAGVQVPKGTVEAGEDPEDAVLRELREESGLVDVARVEVLGVWDQPTFEVLPDGRPVLHRYHAYLLRPTKGLAEGWTWSPTGSGEEEGLSFVFGWQPVAHASLHPLFEEVVGRLRGVL